MEVDIRELRPHSVYFSLFGQSSPKVQDRMACDGTLSNLIEHFVSTWSCSWPIFFPRCIHQDLHYLALRSRHSCRVGHRDSTVDCLENARDFGLSSHRRPISRFSRRKSHAAAMLCIETAPETSGHLEADVCTVHPSDSAQIQPGHWFSLQLKDLLDCSETLGHHVFRASLGSG